MIPHRHGEQHFSFIPKHVTSITTTTTFTSLPVGEECWCLSSQELGSECLLVSWPAYIPRSRGEERGRCRESNPAEKGASRNSLNKNKRRDKMLMS
ncbi:hypothetical protein E2C01_002765 [Portunus trituberculatus]|uniref:Uncharacterized protein n=1 Tax=Portunus trituberculatus TaxID=210409 RepID=A0A5B7CKL9_PORTR|nr:hypothetical protein [Portunus trituberculatus]